uniref:Uncharacterized protein n=1 Tax=Anopheles farauti TaxID=69004 RepID=A0A182QCB5_9DIPT
MAHDVMSRNRFVVVVAVVVVVVDRLGVPCSISSIFMAYLAVVGIVMMRQAISAAFVTFSAGHVNVLSAAGQPIIFDDHDGVDYDLLWSGPSLLRVYTDQIVDHGSIMGPIVECI